MAEQIRLYVRAWDWRLYSFILLFLGLPNIYQLYRVYLVGNEVPDPGSLAIVSQWQFIGLVIEVFQEATVLAIFFFVGSQIRNQADVQWDRAKSVFVFIFGASFLFAASVFLFRDAFITLIGTSPEIRDQTSAFLGVSIFSVPFMMLSAAIVVLFEALNLRRLVFAIAILNVTLRFGFDTLLFGGHEFSLNAGTTGVAWSTLLASAALFIVGVLMLLRTEHFPLSTLRTWPSFKGMTSYLRVGAGSGADSFVRNVAYFFMIVRIINTIGADEIGGYYLAMQILWSFMLVPVLAFADSTKALVANAHENPERTKELFRSGMFITAAMMVIWIGLAPAFSTFAGLLSDDPEAVAWASTAFSVLFVPYVLLSFNLVMDSFFYGTGRTEFLAYQSIITNGTVYLIAFLLYVAGIWTVTFESVMVLFSLGILVDSILTVAFLVKVVYLDAPAPSGATTQLASA